MSRHSGLRLNCKAARQQRSCASKKTLSMITMQEHMFAYHLTDMEKFCLCEWFCSCGMKFFSRMFMIEHRVHHVPSVHHTITRNPIDPNRPLPPSYAEAAKKMAELLRGSVETAPSEAGVPVAARPAQEDLRGRSPGPSFNGNGWPSDVDERRRAPGGVRNKMDDLMQPITSNTRARSRSPDPRRSASPIKKPQNSPVLDWDGFRCASPKTPTFTRDISPPRSPGLTANVDSDSDEDSEEDTDRNRQPSSNTGMRQNAYSAPRSADPFPFANPYAAALPQNLADKERKSQEYKRSLSGGSNEATAQPSANFWTPPPNIPLQSFFSSVPPPPFNPNVPPPVPPPQQQKKISPSGVLPPPKCPFSFPPPGMFLPNTYKRKREPEKRTSDGSEHKKLRRDEDGQGSSSFDDRRRSSPERRRSPERVPPSRGTSPPNDRDRAPTLSMGRSHAATRGGRYVGNQPKPLIEVIPTHSLGEFGENLHAERERGRARTPARQPRSTRSQSRGLSKAEQMRRERERSRTRERSSSRSRAPEENAPRETKEPSPYKGPIFGLKKRRRTFLPVTH